MSKKKEYGELLDELRNLEEGMYKFARYDSIEALFETTEMIDKIEEVGMIDEFWKYIETQHKFMKLRIDIDNIYKYSYRIINNYKRNHILEEMCEVYKKIKLHKLKIKEFEETITAREYKEFYEDDKE
jgi:hypothetical protein